MKRLLNNKINALPLAYLGILGFIFWNYFQPGVIYRFNILSPGLSVANIDFNAYYSAGKAYLQGVNPFHGTRFVYPPTFIPFYSLIARLNYNTARVVWVGFYSACFLLALALVVYRTEARNRLNLIFLNLLIVLVSFPVAYYVQQGQMDLVVASFSFASLVLYQMKQKNLSALCLVVATLVKVTPVLFLITFVIFYRDWKYLLRYLVILTLVILASGIFFPLSMYYTYVTKVIPSSTGSVQHIYNQTLLRFFVGKKYIPQALTILGLGWITVMAWFCGKKYAAESENPDADGRSRKKEFLGYAFFFANGLTILLFSGKAWVMAYVWFILPLAVVLIYALEHGHFWWAAWIVLGAVAIHSRISDGKLFTVINMLGAMICLAGMMAVFYLPKLTLKDSS
jgi:Glycosyltransferase family 87